ncbi:serine acetyltransferase [Rivularia sp. PCC 7116]|uniref:serine acetyltransferase n=1 Tax=Rivularia sp. PCC 7116 TaxID=373994 RepID=UPI00029F2A4F|nr:serine acetyltransferase [Rivularia sp. PCC 7116]AFY55290.1 serine acetyltransferase [Rivularia sp. PCC 7116]
MSVPPLRLYNNFETFFSGEVIIHASAVIAPGVIMQAAPDSKIIIGSGVCIGMGSILQVDTGTLEIESGANLGAGFLMVGAGKIGANACIGSATTVFCASVEPGEVVAPGSIVGDSSRSFTESSTKEMNGRVHQPQLPLAEEAEETQEVEEAEETQEVEEVHKEISSDTSGDSDAPNNSIYSTPPITPSPRPYVSPSPISYFSLTQESTEEIVSSENSSEEHVNIENTEESSAEEPANTNSNGMGNHIYGRSSIKSLLVTLFPHRQNLNEPPEDESEEG